MLGSGRECTLFSQPVSGARGWHLHTYNDTIGTALEFMYPTWAEAFVQMNGEDTLEFISGSSNDTTQYISVFGIDNAGKKVMERKLLDGDTAVDSANTWRYVENAWINAEAAGIVEVRNDGDTAYIMEIEVGLLSTGACHHFNGECESYITFFAGGLYEKSDDAAYQLRFYPDDADCLDATDGFEVLDQLYLPIESGHDNHAYPMPIGPLPKGGYIAVWAIAENDVAKGWCTVQGFDVEVPA